MNPTCSECETQATHILVGYHHTPILEGESPILLCAAHTLDQSAYESCPCCEANEDYTVDVAPYNLRPIYTSGSLDGQGCCSDHP